MAGKINTSPARGTRDLLPDECALRDAAANVILRTYRSFGFQRIETPALERIELLAGSQGGENEKLIYKILKRGEKLEDEIKHLIERERHKRVIDVTDKVKLPPDKKRLAIAARDMLADDLIDLGLRYDLTVPLARYYANNLGALPTPFKAIQIGPVWRAERPQKGRYRQFTQCDVDVLGEPGESAEIESILATAASLSALGLSGFTVSLNDRGILAALANHLKIEPAQQTAVFIALDKLDKVGVDGVLKELDAAGVSGEARTAFAELLEAGQDQGALASLAARVGAGEEHERLGRISAAVSAALSADDKIVGVPSLVRGMGYYTGTIFEIQVADLPFSLAGGGRYDKMIGQLIGRDVPACGFSIGFERLMMVLADRGWSPGGGAKRLALLHGESGAGLARVMRVAATLRANGDEVSVLSQRKKLGKQLDDLEKQGFDGAAMLPAEGDEPEHKWFRTS
jgi:histidyl-tRNA synthetase